MLICPSVQSITLIIDAESSDLSNHIPNSASVNMCLYEKFTCFFANMPRCEKTQYETMIKNLQRENAMITTAWYDLTSRLQSNHVVLQRRHDVPKSWLNKQRQMVNG